MKAISIRQPWAWLILHGGKDVECRSWATDLRGRIAIHAGSRLDRGFEGIRQNVLEVAGVKVPAILPLGAFVGSVEIVDCVRDHDSVWGWDGGWNWVLRDPVVWRPVPAKGQLGFFQYFGEMTPV